MSVPVYACSVAFVAVIAFVPSLWARRFVLLGSALACKGGLVLAVNPDLLHPLMVAFFAAAVAVRKH